MRSKTRFRALRNLRYAGRDVRLGEVLDLEDNRVRELVWMPGTIEPVDARDRARLQERPTIERKAPGADIRSEAFVGCINGESRGYW